MRPVDTDALALVGRVLGIGAPATATLPVDFDDGNLQQVLAVNDLVRRARTPAGSSGVFFGVWEQAHAGAGQLTDSVDPYDIADPGAGYPSPVPDGFDVWLLAAQLAATTGDLSNARVAIQHPASAAAFNTGGASTFTQLVAYWDTDAVIGGGAAAFGADAQGIPDFRGPAWRVPRGASIVGTSQATGAGDIFIQILLGLFPAGLGQDGRA